MMPNCIVKINLMFDKKKIKKKVITQKVIYILMLKQSGNTMFRRNMTSPITLL